MIVTIATEEYDTDRWGRPWIGVIVAWPPSQARCPDISWGSWVGTPGEAGLLTITAAPGDIVRSGQPHRRDPDLRDNDWWVVAADGSLVPTNSVEAYRHWLSRPRPKPQPKPQPSVASEILRDAIGGMVYSRGRN